MGTKSIKTANTLIKLRMWYMLSPQGLSDTEVAERFGVSRATACNYRNELDGVVSVEHGKYTLKPTDDDIEYAKVIIRAAGYKLDENIVMLPQKAFTIAGYRGLEEYEADEAAKLANEEEEDW